MSDLVPPKHDLLNHVDGQLPEVLDQSGHFIQEFLGWELQLFFVLYGYLLPRELLRIILPNLPDAFLSGLDGFLHSLDLGSATVKF